MDGFEVSCSDRRPWTPRRGCNTSRSCWDLDERETVFAGRPMAASKPRVGVGEYQEPEGSDEDLIAFQPLYRCVVTGIDTVEAYPEDAAAFLP